MENWPVGLNVSASISTSAVCGAPVPFSHRATSWVVEPLAEALQTRAAQSARLGAMETDVFSPVDVTVTVSR